MVESIPSPLVGKKLGGLKGLGGMGGGEMSSPHVSYVPRPSPRVCLSMDSEDIIKFVFFFSPPPPSNIPFSPSLSPSPFSPSPPLPSPSPPPSLLPLSTRSPRSPGVPRGGILAPLVNVEKSRVLRTFVYNDFSLFFSFFLAFFFCFFFLSFSLSFLSLSLSLSLSFLSLLSVSLS